ncbi:hypothetical protein EXIGLDRAFT_691613 [Exidia glandulosa HHB12029]|uniref:Uncharacterized protein n=1 Tax=Exidia glandulosa HHB12029 TaxID=1314781 RepID=A0A165IHC0_EXIGL|nr:hypothetical protein EXIGLDRAFT_691613 [Exidia glandulosa HHB12029]
MVGTKFAAALFVSMGALPLASAFVDKIANYTGTFHATETSTYPATFITGYTKVDYLDLTVSFALTRPDKLLGQTVGLPLYNFDFTTLSSDIISNTTFVVDVPLTKANITTFNENGPYVLSAIVSYANGDYPNYIYGSYILHSYFNASVLPADDASSTATAGNGNSSTPAASGTAGEANATTTPEGAALARAMPGFAAAVGVLSLILFASL